MQPYIHFANLIHELPEIPPDSIVSRTIFADEQMKAILFGFAVGQELSEHTSSQRAIIHILEGEADLVLGGDAKTASAGTWAVMEPHLPHSVLARTRTVMLLLMFKSGG